MEPEAAIRYAVQDAIEETCMATLEAVKQGADDPNVKEAAAKAADQAVNRHGFCPNLIFDREEAGIAVRAVYDLSAMLVDDLIYEYTFSSRTYEHDTLDVATRGTFNLNIPCKLFQEYAYRNSMEALEAHETLEVARAVAKAVAYAADRVYWDIHQEITQGVNDALRRLN
jgi:hypothetical protein